MTNITKFLVVAIIATLCFASCDNAGNLYDESYASYTVEGRIIDKITKEPVEEVLVVLNLNLPISEENILNLPPPPCQCWSDENGKFQAYEYFTLFSVKEKNESLPVAFLNGRYHRDALHKDTIIWVNFQNAPFYKHSKKNYKGYYTLQMGEIELERID